MKYLIFNILILYLFRYPFLQFFFVWYFYWRKWGTDERYQLCCRNCHLTLSLLILSFDREFSHQILFFFFLIIFYLFIFIFLAALGLRCCSRAFLYLRQAGASLVAEHGLQACGLSSCGARAQLLRVMWDPPGPGLEPMSPALAGGFPTTVSPGKSSHQILNELHPNVMNSLKAPDCQTVW